MDWITEQQSQLPSNGQGVRVAGNPTSWIWLAVGTADCVYSPPNLTSIRNRLVMQVRFEEHKRIINNISCASHNKQPVYQLQMFSGKKILSIHPSRDSRNKRDTACWAPAEHNCIHHSHPLYTPNTDCWHQGYVCGNTFANAISNQETTRYFL